MAKIRNTLFAAIACAMALQASASGRGPADAVLPAQEAGRLGAAPYRIDIPGNWNGELVILAHGFEPAGTPRPSPMPPNEATSVFLANGYAVAQSGYSSQGWAVREAMDDMERLRRHFARRHGAARRTYLVGFSMGGGIAVSSLEKHPDAYDGALSLCGANVPGVRLAEELFTTLAAFDHFFPQAPGIAGGLSRPQASVPNQADVMSAIARALAGKPETAARLAGHLKVSNEALPGTISLHYLVFQDIARRAGGLPVDNRNTIYRGFGDDEAFNAGVRRYAGDAKAMQYMASAPVLTGRVDKPLVFQYNNDDPTITPRFQAFFAAMSNAAGKARPLTLPPVGDGHCGFTDAQIANAFQVLVDWVGSGQRPADQ